MSGSTPVLPTPALRALTPFDGPLLAAVHAQAFADPDVAGAAWSADAFTDLLVLPTVFGLLAVSDHDEPLGLVLLQGVLDEAEILTLGVAPDGRRLGTGRALVAGALTACRAAGIGVLHLEVAETNLPARALYAATGFQATGRRPGYYHLAGAPVAGLILSRRVDA